jgi:hypothetical protein
MVAGISPRRLYAERLYAENGGKTKFQDFLRT